MSFDAQSCCRRDGMAPLPESVVASAGNSASGAVLVPRTPVLMLAEWVFAGVTCPGQVLRNEWLAGRKVVAVDDFGFVAGGRRSLTLQ